MVVEHSFVTTLEAADALRTAAQFLQTHGFVAEAENAFALDGGWKHLEARRGKPRGKAGTAPYEWPQLVRVEWDRGKIDVAASVSLAARSATWNIDFGTGTTERKADRRTMELMLTTIVRGLELLLANRLPAEQARADWDRLEMQLRQQAERDRRRRRIILIIVLVVVLAAVGLLIFAIVSGNRRY